MTVSFNNNKAYITLTDINGATALVADLLFDWVVLENNTQYSDNEILDILQDHFEQQAQQ